MTSGWKPRCGNKKIRWRINFGTTSTNEEHHECAWRKDSNPKTAPAVEPLLSKKIDKNDSFHFRSALGSLSYLAGHTRLDVSAVVHKLSKFSACSKENHDVANKRIRKCLLRVEEKGLKRALDASEG